MRARASFAVIAGVAVFLAVLPARAQELIGRYTAVIGQMDLFSSGGKALSHPAQILTQDRANYHRFGVRQPGDTSDDYFSTRESRARFAELLRLGTLDPAAAAAIRSGSGVPVLVEIYGRGGQPQYLVVGLAGAGQGTPRPTDGVVGPPVLPNFFATGDMPTDQTAPTPALPNFFAQGAQTDAGGAGQAPAPGLPGPILPSADGMRWMALVVLDRNPDLLGQPGFLMGWLGQDRLQGRPDAKAVDQPAALARGLPQPGDPVVDGYIETLRIQAAAAGTGGPQRVELALPASMNFDSGGNARLLSVSAVTNVGPEDGGAGVARTLQIQAWKSVQIELRLQNALTLSEIPINAEFARVLDAKSRDAGGLVARLVVEVDPATQQRMGGSSRMPRAALSATVISFTLSAGDRKAADGTTLPGEALASFEVPAVQSTTRFDTTSADAVAALYGLPMLGDRIAAGSVQDILPPEFAAGVPGHLTANRDDPYRTIETAAKLAAIVRSYPEIPLAPDAQDFVLFSLMSGPERDASVTAALWKNGVVDGEIGGNEFDRARFYADKAAELSDVLLQRAPALPLSMAWLWQANLDDYDMTRGGFPIAYGSGSNLLSEEPDLLPATPEAAEAYLRRRAELAPAGASSQPRDAQMLLEYKIGPALVPPDVGDQITLEDTGRVLLPVTPEQIVVHADAGRTEVFTTIALSSAVVPEATPPEALLPEGTLESTSSGMLAVAALRLIGGEAEVRSAIEAAVAANSQFTSLERPAQIASQMVQIAGFPARSDFWIGASVSLDDYEVTTGRLAFASGRTLELHVHGIDGIWLRQPSLALAVPAQLESLRADPPTAERIFDAVGSGGLQMALRVAPVTALRNDGSVTLYLDVVEVLVLRQDLQGGRPSIVATIAPAPDEAATKATTSADMPAITPPEILALDHEALDLFHLKLDPGSVNDAGIDRMLIERFVREAYDVGTGTDPVWGRFFEDVEQFPTYPQRQRLRPMFRAWSEARAAALPDRIAVTVSRSSADAPDYPCVTARRWWSGSANQAAFAATLASVLSAESLAVAMAQTDRMPQSSNPALVEGIFVLRHRPLHETMRVAIDCPVLPNGFAGRPPEGLDLAAASYVDAVIDLRDAPMPADTPSGGWYRETYVANLTEARFVSLAAGPDALGGYKGEIVFTAMASEGVFHDRPGGVRSELRETTRIDVAALQAEPAPVPETAAALDVAGLRLGMSPEAFADSARSLFDQRPIAVTGPDMSAEPMQTLHGFVDPDATQLVVGIHPPLRPDGPVLAILRYTVYSSADVSADGVVLALREKYGAPTQEWPDHGRYVWGAPSGPDPTVICNPLNLSDPPPPLTVDPDPRIAVGSALSQPGHWRQKLDWPKLADAILQDPAAAAFCGPTVFAAILDEPAAGRLHLRVWLVDAAATATILADPAFAPPKPEAAKIKL